MKESFGESLRKDSRIQEAKRLLLEVVKEKQQQITEVRPPDPEKQKSYQELLKDFSEYRGGGLWYPFLGSGLGKGSLVELLDGSVKYDFISGIGVHYLGHSHPALIEAAIDGALGDTIMQGNLQQNKESYELAKLLVDSSGLDHCFLSTSGVMANENALKMIFQKRHPADRIFAFEKCFAGRSLFFSNVTDKAAFRDGLPSYGNVDYVPFYDYRDPEESTKKTLSFIKEHLKRYPGKHAVMIMELVLGEGGAYPGTADFFKAIMQLLREHDISVFVDEIQTFGRTTELYAYQHFGLQDYVDIVTIGKLSHVCATIFREDHKPRPLLISQTYTSSTVAIHAARTIINTLLNEGYYGQSGKVARLHNHFSSRLQALADKYPDWVSGPFGIGSMVAFTVFDGSIQKAGAFSQALFQAGVMCFVAGSDPTRIRFLTPAGAVTEEDIDKVVQIVESCLVNFEEKD